MHNIARLLSLCADYAVDVRITAEDVAFVDSIYRGRDPGEAGLLPAGDPTEPDARRGIAIAEALLAPRQ